MSSPRGVLGACLLLAAAAWGSSRAHAEEGGPAECVRHRTEARYRNYGYDHLVHLDNLCKKPATCEVSTDVNPEKQRVTVKGHETKTVVTFVGSPAREFHAMVECSGAG